LSPARCGIGSELGEVEKKWPDNTVRIGVFYMRQAIETAPRDGSAIILENDAGETYDVAHWSAEAGEWVGENGEPAEITPSHWYPMSDKYALIYLAKVQLDKYLECEGSSNPSQVGPSAPRARWRFAASSIIAILIAAALLGLYFEQETQLPSQDSQKTDLLALQQQAEADQAGAREAAQVKQAVEPSAPQARQSLEKEQRSEVLANELADARRTINTLNLQVRAEAPKTAQLLGQEREKTAAAVQDATAARQELTASAVQHRQALEEERARSAALANELAMARREIETQAALSSKTGDEAAQLKQTGEKTTAELQQERDRAEASSRELAIARREIETNVALLNKARDDAAQLKQAAESAMAELRQRGQAVEQKPAAVEERPGVSLPAWANSYASVKPAQTAMQPDVATENSKSAIKPGEPARVEHKPRGGYSCQHYRTYDPASGTYMGYEGRRHSCP